MLQFDGRPAPQAGWRSRIGSEHEPEPYARFEFRSDSDRARRIAAPSNLDRFLRVLRVFVVS
jgi:hypothetical protein